MAAEVPIQALCNEATCPICLDYFKCPMTTKCGHNFCQACLGQHRTASGGPFSCPQCRAMIVQKNLMVNRHLARMVEYIKELQEKQIAKRKRGECEKHQEPLQLFCKEDEVLICMKCNRSMEHQEHNVVPVDEVSDGYKSQLETEKEKITSAFESLQTLLEKKKHFWLSKLKNLETIMKDEEKQTLAEISAETSGLSQLITEMEEKCLEPPSEFLQDIKNTSFEKRLIYDYVDLSPKWEEKLRIHSQKNSDVRKALESLKESLVDALDKANLERVWDTDILKKAMSEGKKVNVNLDRRTACSLLSVSKDLKTVTCAAKWWKVNDDNPQRFDWDQCVLGCRKFISGRHYWEVEVKMEKRCFGAHLFDNPPWAIGVARDSVKRKGPIDFNPIEGIWAIGELISDMSCISQISAFTFPKPTPLRLREKPKKIQVVLDYEEGWVDFFDVERNEFIFTFYSATFAGEAIRPFFCTDDVLSLCKS
ncbi:zinc finger protein RFP-like [Sceloporus undulatus]|uniref:zinc finger protein RFP-like n=1 Tax=Sceloporus undulatus TaxID=8520 RepID=UPI001C4D5DCD|nr:zinc finger protein RFP-like [Sceloporus undulatus]